MTSVYTYCVSNSKSGSHQSQLRLSLNSPLPTIGNPRRLCRDVTHVGHFGLGDVDVRISFVYV